MIPVETPVAAEHHVLATHPTSPAVDAMLTESESSTSNNEVQGTEHPAVDHASGPARISATDSTGMAAEGSEETHSATAIEDLFAREPRLEFLAHTNPSLKNLLETAFAEQNTAAQYRRLFPTLEQAELAEEVGQLFTSSDEPPVIQAKSALADSRRLAELSELFFSGSAEDTSKLLQELYDVQLERDVDGALLLDSHTLQPRGTGAYERLMETVNSAFLDAVEEGLGRDVRGNVANEPLVKAVATIRDAVGWRQWSRGRAQEEHIGATETHTGVDRYWMHPRPPGTGTAEADQFRRSILSNVTTQLKDIVDRSLGGLPYPDFAKQAIRDATLTEIGRRAGSSRDYLAVIEGLAQKGGLNQHTREAITAHVMTWAKPQITTIIEANSKRIGAEMAEAQTNKLQNLQKAGRREPAGGGAAASTRQMSEADKITAMEKKLGRRLSDREILEL